MGYVVGHTGAHQGHVSSGTTPANVGFFRSEFKTNESFINLAQYISRQDNNPQTFASADDAEIWLTNNGYWTSYTIPPTPSPTQSPTQTSTVTPTPSVTSTQTQTPTPSITASQTPTVTQTPTPSVTSTQTQTPTPSITGSQTPTPTPSITASQTATPTPSVTKTQTPTPTNTPTLTQTPTNTPSVTPTNPGNLRVLVLGDAGAPTVASYISSYITSTGKTISYSAVTIGTTYTGSGNITKGNYDVVLMYTNGAQTGTSTLATALTNYVNGGGSVVSGVFLWNLYPTGFNHSGTTCFNTQSQTNPSGSYTVVSATTITNGIGSPLPSSFSNGNVPIISGSIELAKYTDNQPLLYVRNVGSAKLVSINAFPGNIVSNSSPICKIFGNAILYAGGKI